MSFPINLIGELVAVSLDPIGGTIRLPDWKRNLSGTIIATGPGCSKDLVVSSRVAFGAAVGMDATIGSENVRILKEQDLDFVYEPHEVDNFGRPFPHHET